MSTPSVSCVVTLSKPECVPLVKRNLLTLGGEVSELLLIVDGLVHLDTDDLVEKYPNVRIHRVNGAKPQTDNIPRLRDRISHVRNESKRLVSGELVFSFEDDTEVPPDALTKLLADFSKLTNPGVVSGVQVGRHSRKIIGAWYADDFLFPTEMKTLGPKEVVTPIAEVDGTGFFCFLTRKELYKRFHFGWKEPVGPDVWYGMRLRQMGYHNYVDQSVVCPHSVGDLTLVPDENTVRARFYLDRTGRWSHELIPH